MLKELWRAIADGFLYIDNDEKVASHEKHIESKTGAAQKPYTFSYNGQNSIPYLRPKRQA